MKRLNNYWNQWVNFLWSPIDSRPLGLLRILVGAVLFLKAIGYLYARPYFLEADSLVSLSSAHKYNSKFLWEIYKGFDWTKYLSPILGLLVLSSISVILGFKTRLATFFAIIALLTLQYRNPLIIFFADRVIFWVLIFGLISNWGACFSMDAYFRKKVIELPRWPVMLMMLTVNAFYAQQVYFKLLGDSWLNGTAVYYAIRREGLIHFPLPVFLDHMAFYKIATWSTIYIEVLLAGFIWLPFSLWRKTVVILGITLHLGIDYSIYLQGGGLLMIALILLWWPWPNSASNQNFT